jgi:predicted metal-dependent enzyme (double-stranded beta helix superfamily)
VTTMTVRQPRSAYPAPEPALLTALATAAASGLDPESALVGRLRAAYPRLARRAADPPGGHPYSRQALHADETVEIMVARWAPDAECAPHNHGGCSGFVVVLSGALIETDFTWHGDELVAGAGNPRVSGSSRGFGPEVIHAMSANASGAVTLHVYAPRPERMNVYDLERREVLDLVGDFGAWIPDGAHPRAPFATLGPRT